MSPITTLLISFDTPARRADPTTGSAVRAVLRALLSAIAIAAGVISGAVALYLVKSAIGINVLPGHSPLHDLLFEFVR